MLFVWEIEEEGEINTKILMMMIMKWMEVDDDDWYADVRRPIKDMQLYKKWIQWDFIVSFLISHEYHRHHH